MTNQTAPRAIPTRLHTKMTFPRALSVAAVAAAARAALPPLAPGASADDGFALRLFPPSSPAVCLDGSPAGYYIRPGVGAGASVWLLGK